MAISIGRYFPRVPADIQKFSFAGRRFRGLQVALVLAFAVALVDGFSVATDPFGRAFPLLDDLLVPIALGLATLALFLARRHAGAAAPTHRALTFFLALFAFDAVAAILFGLIDLGAPGQLGVAALAFAIPCYPLGFLGLISFPRAIPLSRPRFAVDLTMILIGGSMTFLQFIIAPFLEHTASGASANTWAECLVLPIADLVLLTGIVSFIVSHPHISGRSVVGVITIAFVTILAGDTLQALVDIGSVPFWATRLVASSQIVGALCATWVAYQITTSPRALVERPNHFLVFGRAIPVMVIGSGFLALVAAAINDQNSLVSALLAAGAVLLLVTLSLGRNFEARLGRTAAQKLLRSEISEQTAQAEHVRHDSLTGLGNRLALTERVEATSETGPMTVAIIGLTSLRDVNEALGFAAGDQVLVAVGAVLRTVVPASVLVVRLSGDVFALAIRAEAASAGLIVRAALGRLIEPFEIGGQHIGLIINAGQATKAADGDLDSGAVIRWAEAARAAARRSHRLLVVDERREAEQTLPKSTSVRLPELRTAITTGALVLYYQPYRERGCEQFSQVEALVRWPHPVEGLLVPGAFLPLAEVSGLMGELDRWVLSEACRQARAWRDTGRPTRIAVNASAASIHDPEYSAVVMRTLARHGLPGSAIEIEITEESAFEGSDERLLILASELQALGVRLAIDDFGTGASSLSRLRDMPVETLKIDRSFVTTALTNPRDAAITESIVGLAKRLGLKTVAEGVEDAATLAYLDGLGVDYIQGYFVCRPVPPAELFARLWAAGDE